MPPPPPVSTQTQQSWEHGDQIAALANQASAAMTGPVPDLLKTLLAAALARWSVQGLDAAGQGAVGLRALFDFRAWFAAQLAAHVAQFPVLEAVVPRLEDALRVGAHQAVVESGADPLPRRDLILEPARLEPLRTLAVRRHQIADRADALIDVARTRNDVVQAAALAQRTVTVTTSVIDDLVHEAARSGIDQVAAAGDWQEILQGERNCCVRCASFQGAIADGPDFLFYPVLLGSWLYPGDHGGVAFPLHPHCRCRGRLVRAHLAHVSSLMDPGSLTMVLQREARRSIVLGLALPSESQALRLRAAKDLLARPGGARLPKTVEQRARRRIAADQFRTRPDVRKSP